MYKLKAFPDIYKDLVAKILSETPITDVRAGSIISTLLEGVAQEDAQQYIAMLDIIQNYNLDTTSGEDLEERALEYGLEKLDSFASTGYVSFGDSAITKRQSLIYANSPAPISGQVYVDVETVDDVGSFATSGTIIVGRGTVNAETIAYSSITDNTEYQRFNLSAGFVNVHATGETVIYSQGGARSIPVGQDVYLPAGDLSAEVHFTTIEAAEILDGEDTESDVLVRCSSNGSSGNAPINSITVFSSLPWSTATVTNDESFVNGREIETDQELRDRIRNTVQSLSRGTVLSILSKIARVQDDDGIKSVVSSTYREATVLDKSSYIYIDDGTGFEPSHSAQGFETVIDEAAGTEQFLHLDNFPLLKGSLTTLNSEPYALISGYDLEIGVGGETETIIFSSTAFKDITSASAEEIAAHINDSSTLVEARTTDTRSGVMIQAIVQTNEFVKILSGTANAILGFEEDVDSYTLNLYKNDVLLSKDGYQAFVDSGYVETFSLSDADTLTFQVDGNTTNTMTVTFEAVDPLVVANGGITNLSSAGVVAIINEQAVGVIASVTEDRNVRISSIKGPAEASSIQVTGGLANTQFGFPTLTLYSGAQKDYVLNRYNGQIELTDPLIEDDKITAGSSHTRAFLTCVSAEPYVITSGETLVIDVDGGGDVTHTFSATASLTVDQVIALLNASSTLRGITAYSKNVSGSNYLCIRTNTWTESIGSIEVDSSSTATALDFTADTVKNNQAPSYGSVETQTSIGDFVIGRDMNLLIIVDDDSVNNATTYYPQVSSAVTAPPTEVPPLPPADTSHFYASVLSASYAEDDFFQEFKIQFDNATTTASLRNAIRYVSEYDYSTGRINITPLTPPDISKFTFAQNATIVSVDGVASAFGAAPGDNDFTDYGGGGSASGTFAMADISLAAGGDLAVGALLVIDDADSSSLDVYVRSITGAAPTFIITVESVTDVLATDPVVGDSFKLIPVTPKNNVDLLNNTAFISLSNSADIELTNGEDKWSITSQTAGTDGSIQITGGTANALSYPFNSDGTTIGTLTLDAVSGLSIGLPVVLAATGVSSTTSTVIGSTSGSSSPYTIVIHDVPDILAYTTGATATIDSPAITFASDGTANGTFTVDDITGLYIGQAITISDTTPDSLSCYIRDISGNRPFTITVESPLDISSFTLALNASLSIDDGFDFDTTVSKGVDGYKYYTGLLQKVQWLIDANDKDYVNYPGYKAAGVQLEVAAPVIKTMEISVDVSTEPAITLDSVSNMVKSEISSYINGLGVGNDVILSEIVAAIQSIDGITDIVISSPTSNTDIADNEVPRINSKNIYVG